MIYVLGYLVLQFLVILVWHALIESGRTPEEQADLDNEQWMILNAASKP